MLKNIIIINRRQFGYWTDYYYFSKYLSRKFNIYYLCYDDTSTHPLQLVSFIIISIITIGNIFFMFA